jgi:uncharacterized membrane protein
MAEMIGPIELIVAAFSDESKAAAVLKDLKKLEKDGVILLVNAAVMVKDEKGKVSIKETEDISGGKGALFGAIAGGLIGLLGGPVGVIIGAAAGAATGGVAASKIDMGFPNDTLKELDDSLTPGTSAILALIQHQWVDLWYRVGEGRREALPPGFERGACCTISGRRDQNRAENRGQGIILN